MKFANKLLSEVVFFQEGPGVRKFQFRNEGVKLLNVGNINKGVLDTSTTKLYISEDEAYGKYKHFLVDEGDLLIASSGIVVDNFHNKIAYVKKEHLPLCLNTSTIRFKTLDENAFSIDYLKFYLKTTHFKNQLRKLITGAAQLNFGPSHLKKITLPVPSLTDQLHIANLLSKAETLISKRKESIRLLDQYLKSTFLEMFGDPVRNEKGWENCSLSEIGSLDRGVSKARPRNSPELLGGIYPLIQTGDVTSAGIFITSYKQTYSELGLKQSKLWPKGTMLITIAANIAQTSILSFDACFPDSVVGFVINKKKSQVLYMHFLFKFFQALLESKASQTAQKNINLEILRNLVVPCPPLALQTQFAQKVEKVEALKAQYQQSLQELEQLYGSLSQKAFNGELTIKEKILSQDAEPNIEYKKSEKF